jgi:hypothetical protein
MPKVIIIGNAVIDLTDNYDKDTKIYLVSYSGGFDTDYPENVEFVTDINILDFYSSMKFEEDEDSLYFVDCTGFSKNYIDVMYLLQTARLDKRAYISQSPLIPVKISTLSSVKNYNLFEGEKMPSTILKGEKNIIKEFMRNSSEIIYEYLKAGFDEMKIKELPPGWCLNLSLKELNLFLEYYGLWPNAEDYNPNTKDKIFLMNPVLDFIKNAQYRKIVLDTLIAVVSNFLVRNNYVDISEISDWYNLKTWKYAIKKL